MHIKERGKILLEKVMPYIKYPIIYRISRLGVPHLVVTTKKKRYSICYFRKTRTFRIFFPYPSLINRQTKIDFYLASDVINYFNLKMEGTMAKFKKGDMVRIVNAGKTYTANETLAHRLGATKWIKGYGDMLWQTWNGKIGRVINVLEQNVSRHGKHYCDVLIDIGDNHEIIIGEDGLEIENKVKFLKGDRVRQLNNITVGSPFATVTKVAKDGQSIYHQHDGAGGEGSSYPEDFILINDIVPLQFLEYDRIQKEIRLLTSFDEKGAKIIDKLKEKGKFEHLNLYFSWMENFIKITCKKPGKLWESKIFQYTTLCDGFRQFQNALLWLLNEADIKDIERENKIKELERKQKDLQIQIDQLRR